MALLDDSIITKATITREYKALKTLIYRQDKKVVVKQVTILIISCKIQLSDYIS